MERNSKHTPGPWKVIEHKHEWGDSSDDGMGTSATSYAVYASDKKVTGCGWNIQGKADANLIAAAPELLDCAEEMSEWVVELFDHYGLDQDSIPKLKRLRAAIAKARQS